ncbi:MAG: hypothetical protein U0Y08_12335 [Bacteroidia bacterium]
MKIYCIVFTLLISICGSSFAQPGKDPVLPIHRIQSGVEALRKAANKPATALPAYTAPSPVCTANPVSAFDHTFIPPVIPAARQPQVTLLSPSQIDTAYVGIVPHDTLVVTGNWTCNGPVYVFNDGVLIFDNANATILGDIYIWGHGTLTGDSTSFHLPQAWFYQRSIMVVDSGNLTLDQCSFEFSGLSHNFLAVGSPVINMHHIHQNDWTTAGLWGQPQVNISYCNLMGEYIVTENANFHVSHSDSLLLWHHYPDSAVVNTSYPSGVQVNSYTCNNTQPGIDGIGYSVQLDTCGSVWWALMPVNGSDVTISNSTIRAVGAWFQNGDSVNASGLVNNAVYSSFTAPLPDRNLHFNSCNVQTWSLYVFDTSYLHITGCILGEVGTQYKSVCFAENFLMDGSGGYFWATDTSFIISSLSSAMSIVRSERNGIFVFGYGTCNTNPPTALGSSVMIVVQSSVPQDPVAEESAVAWYANINGPASSFINTSVAIQGTAFIDQGPQGSWMDFQAYSLYYQQTGDTIWYPIVVDSSLEIRHGVLANWNTIGLAAGNYTLKLTLINTLGDSVDAQKAILLQPATIGINELNENDWSLRPVPADQQLIIIGPDAPASSINYQVLDLSGKCMTEGCLEEDNAKVLNTATWANGCYIISIRNAETRWKRKFVVIHEN